MALTEAQQALLAELQGNEAPAEAGLSLPAPLERLAEITARLHHLVDELARLTAEQGRCVAALEGEATP